MHGAGVDVAGEDEHRALAWWVVTDAVGEVEQHVEQELEVALVLAQVPSLAEIGVEEQGVFDVVLEHLLAHGVADGAEDEAPDRTAERQSGQGANGGDGVLGQLTGEIANELGRQQRKRNRCDEEDDVGCPGLRVACPSTEIVGLFAAERR